MKTSSPSPHFISYTLFLCLLIMLSRQTLADSYELQTVSPPGNKVCLTGWLPLQHTQNSSCLQITTCYDDSDNKSSDANSSPDISEQTCPDDLHKAITADPNITAQVTIKTSNGTHSEYISSPSQQPSSLWSFSWSAANVGMSLLHIFKASEKAELLRNGKTSNKNIYFFISYMIGAFHHIIEMPVVTVAHFITGIPHLLMHTGALILSIIERFLDCTCCSQTKNGHNIMIVFHIMALTLATLW